MPKGWVYKYKINDNYYVYDVNSNNILSVTEDFYQFIDKIDFHDDKFEVREEQHIGSNDHKLEKVAQEIIKYNKEKSFFEPNRLQKMIFPFSKKEYALILDNLLNHVILNVTEDCNFRCEYCKYSGNYLYTRTHNKKYMDSETAVKAIRFMLDRSKYIVENTDERLAIGFYGGEPLLNYKTIRDCVDYVNKEFNYLRDRIHFSMTTNLSPLNEEIADLLISNNFSILVSLNGPEYINDMYRKDICEKGTFDKVMKNLNLIKVMDEAYYKSKVGFSIVITPPYDIRSIVDFFVNSDLVENRVLLLSDIDREDTTFFDRFDNPKELEDKYYKQLLELKEEYRDSIIKGVITPRVKFLSLFFEEKLRDIYRRYLVPIKEEVFPNGICLPGMQKLLVSPEGKFYICEKIGYVFPIGDLKGGFDIDRIFSIIEEYIRISEPMCVNCWAIRLCKACFLRAIKGEELSAKRKAENCDILKGSVASGLKFFCEVMEANPNALDFLKDLKQKDMVQVAFEFIENYRKQAIGNGFSL